MSAQEGVALSYNPSRWQRLKWWVRATFTPREPSRLVTHAEEEMRRAGLYDADSDYGGMIPGAVMKLVKAHASEGHSGMSHALTLQIFNRVANYKTLTPITSDPSEWGDVSSFGGRDGKPVYQNRRDSSLFSEDGGKTYYSVDDEKREVKTAAAPTRR